MLRRRRLHDGGFTGAAGVFRPAGAEDTVLGRNKVEPFGDFLADDVHRTAAARASHVFRGDHNLDARQMWRQGGATLAAPAGRHRALRIPLFPLGRALRHRLLDVFEGELQLVRIEFFGAPAELHVLQLAQQVAQSVVLLGQQSRPQ
jgi:hypothetical protein